MSVEDKIKQSKRWLEKIQSRKFGSKDSADFILSFITTANSIPDHLLSDMAVELGVSIDLDSNSLRRDFLNTALNSHNNEAILSYIMFKSYLFGMHERDPIGKFMNLARNRDTHRLLQKPSLAILDAGDFTVDSSKIPSDGKPLVIEKKVKVSFYFEGLSDVDVDNACLHYLGLMENFVKNIKNHTPRSL